MFSGKLEHEILLQTLQETNVQGENKQTWVTIATVWANIISQRGSEAFEAARINARQTLRILIRYRDDVDTSSRIEWQGQQYNIIAVDRTNRRKGELWITAQVMGAE